MTKNVQAIEQEKVSQGDRLVRRRLLLAAVEDQTEDAVDQKMVITPLHLLLNEIPLEKLLGILHTLNVSFTLGGKGHDFLKRRRNFTCIIWGKGIVRYESGGNSPQQALLNALVKFFAGEQKDRHEYH